MSSFGPPRWFYFSLAENSCAAGCSVGRSLAALLLASPLRLPSVGARFWAQVWPPLAWPPASWPVFCWLPCWLSRGPSSAFPALGLLLSAARLTIPQVGRRSRCAGRSSALLAGSFSAPPQLRPLLRSPAFPAAPVFCVSYCALCAHWGARSSQAVSAAVLRSGPRCGPV